MNRDGRPHSNRAFRALVRDVALQLKANGEPRRVIALVVEGMARHENRKRLLHPGCLGGETRSPVPRSIITAAIALAARRRAA